MKKNRLPLLSLLLLLVPAVVNAWDRGPALGTYVDPRIGSEGLGRVVVGPSCPFGMVKPSPDCTVKPNSGWLPMPAPVNGFSQTHVSGTGGGPKYGNVLIQPYCSGMDQISHPMLRKDEDISLAYYGTTFENGIKVEVTIAERASQYRITYPSDSMQCLLIDAGWFLGEQNKPDAREAQNFVGSQIQIVSETEVQGYTRIRAGWNEGRAYTVYFSAQFDRPITQFKTWSAPAAEYADKMDEELRKTIISDSPYQVDNQRKTGALLCFNPSDTSSAQSSSSEQTTLNVKIGISFISELKACQNAKEQIPHWYFDQTRQACIDKWEALLSKIEIGDSSKKAQPVSDSQRRQFYTAIYHTLLEPVDRTGENPLWSDPGVPYYDDFYAIWDTYRTSSPLITLLDPQRETDIINSLLNICHRDGYMPDARSGNCNGRTQGGSNAEIIIADAYAKGLTGIDWEDALKCMLVDATIPPGGDQEAEGRGGLVEYLRYGYIPYGIDRAGNRTVEYAFCDWAIAQVAKGLGYNSIYEQYMKQSEYWKNLWRADYEHAGVKGFIMPRSAEGEWLDEVPFGHSKKQRPTFLYTPVTAESPWYTPWWGTFMYEATSWEYSLSIPHDVSGLIEQCGGPEMFRKRLDTFFDEGFYNVNNEPSFLTPCLYHWIGRPDLTGERVRQIITDNFNDTPLGLPGNDDSGAMSSWLAFHYMGLYPNAGTDYYLLHAPLLPSTTIHLSNGKDFTIVAPRLSDKRRYVQSVKLNGVDYPSSFLSHSQLMEGGVLEFIMSERPSNWGQTPCIVP